ncbi:chemotaxis protein CheC [Sporolactobacillus sp. THM19-2]|uniref:chemotaxis protein CheC n=1 Tax=Sporolactobacillus sp. THM19-2 TaxID=2511171 RepID=UPI00102117CC|nr:chemotaxis protein CheC [Sporolactobacillus sp. THM19-2]RYL92379.1 chemotaxis protein CheC [Sporolactobacillus sp. THM19-2]
MTGKNYRNDILRELFNIGVGQAAATLSDIIEKKIVLDVPDVKVLNTGRGKVELDRYLKNVAQGAVMVSTISFDRQLEGQVSLIFPATKMHRFIDLCLHENRDETDSLSFTDIDFDTIKEIGNIILNAIIGQLSNTVGIPVEYTLPDVNLLDTARADLFVSDADYRLVLMMYITFNIEGTEIEGAIVMNMTLRSLDEILTTIERIYDGR